MGRRVPTAASGFSTSRAISFRPCPDPPACIALAGLQRRYIAAMDFNSRRLVLFDFQTQKWEDIAKITLGFPNWSKGGDYVYFLHGENEPSVMRVHIRDRKVERVADLKNFRQGGYWTVWLGMAPDDSPLLLSDTGTQEIDALDWQSRAI